MTNKERLEYYKQIERKHAQAGNICDDWDLDWEVSPAESFFEMWRLIEMLEKYPEKADEEFIPKKDWSKEDQWTPPIEEE